MVLLRSCVSKNDNHQSAVGTTEKNHPYSVAPTALRFL